MDPEASILCAHAKWPRVVVDDGGYFGKGLIWKKVNRAGAEERGGRGAVGSEYAEAGYLWDELEEVAWLASVRASSRSGRSFIWT